MIALWLWSRRFAAMRELQGKLQMDEAAIMRLMRMACFVAFGIELLVYTLINLVFHPFA